MSNRVAIITGASSGFGLLTSVELAKEGFTVIATMRDLSKQSIFQSYIDDKEVYDRIHFHRLDVTDEASVESLSSYIDTLDRVDVLLNNAGFAAGGFSEEITLDEYRKQFETNVFGLIAVTQAVLPKMRTQGYGKILNMSSISGKFGFPGMSPYVASKHAVEGFSESLRLEMKPYGVDVAIIEPGSFRTNIWTNGKQVTEASLLKTSPYYDYMQSIHHYMQEQKDTYGDPIVVARLVATLAKQKELKKFRFPIGKGIHLMLRLKTLLPWRWLEALVLKQIK
ncbi:oxidoreductase [Pontibacillus halophilus]|uniref:oxidoreductase n=1 Tax=Pontibacillus halophilus TaxID=516704 RepID=UPI00040945E6|nr:oxidoreductase [Pontibacillus halophilus]